MNIRSLHPISSFLVFSFIAALVSFVFFQVSAATTTYYVSPTGSDANNGSATAPWKTIKKAFSALTPGSTLIVKGGTYNEQVQSPGIVAGTSANRITVKAAPGERPIISGLLWMSGASYWTFDGINVTWNASNASNQHMVKMTSGTGWRITNAEIWGARSYAGVLVAGTPSGWSIDHSYIHDTYPSNSTNQDHLIYVNGGTGGGTITRNLFANSRNGRGVKIGPPSGGSASIGNVTVSYNTFYNNTGPSNIQLSYGASNNKIFRNIMVKSGATNITAYNLNGSGNVAYENVGWDSTAVMDKDAGLTDRGGNAHADPQLNVSTFKPGNSQYADYGRYASGDTGNAPSPTPTPPTPPASDAKAPTVPANFEGAASGSNKVTLSWDASTDNTAVTGYTLYRNGTAVKLGSVTDYIDSNLKASTAYTYQIEAFDAAGNKSAKTASVSVTTAAAGTAADTTAPSVALTAPKNGDMVSGIVAVSASALDDKGVAKVEFRIDGSLVATKTASPYTYSWDTTKLVGGHTVEAKAVDTSGNTKVSSISVTTNSVAAPSSGVPTPTGLSATVVGGSQINLTWNPINVYRIDIYRDGVKVGSNSTDAKYGDTYKLGPGATYQYYIVARDSEGRVSAPSATITASTSGTTSGGGSQSANVGTLTGKVSDKNGNAINGARVSVQVNGTTVSALTNSGGVYVLSDIPAVSYPIVYSASGFNTKNDNVTVLAGVVKTKNVTLSK